MLFYRASRNSWFHVFILGALCASLTACNNVGNNASLASLNSNGGSVNRNSPTPTVTVTASPTPTSTPTVSPSPSPTATPLTLSAPTQAFLSQSVTIQVTGGKTPYAFQVTSGICTINSTSGVLSTPSVAGNCAIKVTDAANATQTATIKIVVSSAGATNDTYLSHLLHLVSTDGLSIEADRAWSVFNDCSGIRVAIVDTGVDHYHPDIQSNLAQLNSGGQKIYGRNFSDEVYNKPSDYPYSATYDIRDHNFHGTHVAGILGAVGNNGAGVTGICWKAQLLIAKAMDYNGEGTVSDVVDGINWAMLNGSKIINLSISGVSASSTNFAALQSKLQAASDQGILLVIAAGNEGKNIDTTPVYPASFHFANQITVGANTPKPTNTTLALSSFSNYGPNSVDIAAPGELQNPNNTSATYGIPSLAPIDSSSTAYRTQYNVEMEADNKATLKTPSGYMRSKGTSMATPMVAGAAALLWAKYPSLTAGEVKAKILSSGRSVSQLDGKVRAKKSLFMRSLLTVP